MRIRWRGLELPVRVEVEKETLTDKYGKFTAAPFERGFGHSIGNSLRRILLSSLEGSAVVSVKINGISHEFTPIPGVVEDVAEILGAGINIQRGPLTRESLALMGSQGVSSARMIRIRPVRASTCPVPRSRRISRRCRTSRFWK